MKVLEIILDDYNNGFRPYSFSGAVYELLDKYMKSADPIFLKGVRKFGDDNIYPIPESNLRTALKLKGGKFWTKKLSNGGLIVGRHFSLEEIEKVAE